MSKERFISLALGILLGIGISSLFYWSASNERTQGSPKVELERLRQQISDLKNIPPPNCPISPEDQLPVAPDFKIPLNSAFEVGNDGFVKLLWSEVQYARFYQISLYNKLGKKIMRWRSKEPALGLSKVPFDKTKDRTIYSVKVAAINRLDQVGPESTPRGLISRRIGSVMAPKIESITVEE